MKIALNIVKNLAILIMGLPGYIIFSLLGDVIGGLVMLLAAIATSIVMIACGHWIGAVAPIISWILMMNFAYELVRRVDLGWR